MSTSKNSRQDKILTGGGTPADTPIELMYYANGLYYYSAHCCDAEYPHSGVIVSPQDDLTCGCGNGLGQGLEPVDPPPEGFERNNHGVIQPSNIACHNLDGAGQGGQFDILTAGNGTTFRVDHENDPPKARFLLLSRTQRYEIRRIAVTGWAMIDGIDYPFSYAFYYANPVAGLGGTDYHITNLTSDSSGRIAWARTSDNQSIVISV